MHEIALLKSENRILREQNDMLSKRRRAKKIRLRQGGSMTLAEGQDIQNQKDVEAQIHMETRYGSGRKRRTEKREQRCGTCGIPGHNARTCKKDMGMSEEDDSE